MKRYRLTIYVVRMIIEGQAFFSEDHIDFKEPSIENAIKRAKILVEKRKKAAIEKINNLFHAKKITEDKKEELIQSYPNNSELIETIVHSVSTE